MTKSNIFARLLAGTMMIALAASPALADGPVKPRTEAEEKASFEADRADILGMAGNYKVRFDMRETTSWRSDYKPIDPKTSGGHEIVRVIEDTGRHIKLQHILVAEHEGKSFVIKHWRQDWTYEPENVLVYAGQGRWNLEKVPERMRKGRWSQTVWQVDDSPRYGGWGQWTTEGGIRRWRSNWTWRPLARRDAVRKPVYDRYLSINRHSPTPTGWIHWQDNMKMGPEGGEIVPFVQEALLNTYDKYDGYNVKVADDYWEKSKGYWAKVRTAWDKAIATGNGVSIEEEAQAGTVISMKLMGLADEIAEGKTAEAKAVAEAEKLIAGATKR